VATVMSVTQAAERAIGRNGKVGVSTRYIRDEIERKNLKATRLGA
jgi:predicted Ser/Thr protein kinase